MRLTFGSTAPPLAVAFVFCPLVVAVPLLVLLACRLLPLPALCLSSLFPGGWVQLPSRCRPRVPDTVHLHGPTPPPYAPRDTCDDLRSALQIHIHTHAHVHVHAHARS